MTNKRLEEIKAVGYRNEIIQELIAAVEERNRRINELLENESYDDREFDCYD